MAKQFFLLLTIAAAVFYTSAEEAELQMDDEELTTTKDEELFEFKTPELTEEEEHSQHMPVHMECDGCKLIANLLTSEFQKVSNLHKKRGVLYESEIISVIEKVCQDKYEDYGGKEIDGVLRLTGPGTEAEGLPGVTTGGGRWPKRIRELCSRYEDEIDDQEFYAAWRGFGDSYSKYLCYSPNRPRNVCFQSEVNNLEGKQKEEIEKQMQTEENDRMVEVKKLMKSLRKAAKLAKKNEL